MVHRTATYAIIPGENIVRRSYRSIMTEWSRELLLDLYAPEKDLFAESECGSEQGAD